MDTVAKSKKRLTKKAILIMAVFALLIISSVIGVYAYNIKPQLQYYDYQNGYFWVQLYDKSGLRDNSEYIRIDCEIIPWDDSPEYRQVIQDSVRNPKNYPYYLNVDVKKKVKYTIHGVYTKKEENENMLWTCETSDKFNIRLLDEDGNEHGIGDSAVWEVYADNAAHDITIWDCIYAYLPFSLKSDAEYGYHWGDKFETSEVVKKNPIQFLKNKGNGEIYFEIDTNNTGITSWEPEQNWKPKHSVVSLKQEINEYTINYNLNGGTGDIPSQHVEYNDYFTITDKKPSKSGYNFKYWAVVRESDQMIFCSSPDYGWRSFKKDSNGNCIDEYAKDGNNWCPFYGGSQNLMNTDWINTSLNADESFTFYALYDEVSYNITYDLDGGSLPDGKTNPDTYTVNSEFTLTNPEKEGYKFTGWTGTGLNTQAQTVTVKKGSTGDRSYTAHWKKKAPDVTIEHYVMDTDGKYPAAPKKTQTVKYEYFTLLKSEQLKDNSLIKAGAIEYDPDSTKRETLVTGSTVIKLYYKRIKHNVTFNAAYNGGRHASGDSKDITVQFYYGADIPLDSYRAMKLNNYKFKGWNTSPDAKDVLGSQKMGTSDITYYAVYYKQITVTFTDSEGTTTRTAELYNNEAGANIEVPEIADYTGWADNTVTTYDIEDINEEKAESINKTGENERTDGENISPGNMQDKSAAVMPDTAGKEEETTVAQTPADGKTKESTGSDKAASTAESGNSKASDSTDSTTDSKNDSTTKTSSSAGNGKTYRMAQDITGNTDKTIQPYEIQETPDNNKAEQTHTPAGTDKLVSEYKSTGYTSIKDINKDGATDAQITPDTRTITVSESRDYYALYSAGVTLSYVLNGGTENETTVPVEDTAYCNASALDTIKGKKLKLARCEKPEYDENGYIHSYSFVVWAENSEEGSRFAQESEYELKQNTVMYAMWDEQLSPIEYDIVFDGNKGVAVKHVPSPVHAVYDKEVTLPDTKTERLGFTFLNWNTRADGEGTAYNPSDKVKNLTTVNGSEVKLYAQWKKRKIHVVKAASTSYNADIIKRTPGDDEWYNTTGRLSIDELKDYADNESIQVWKIDNQGNITRTK